MLSHPIHILQLLVYHKCRGVHRGVQTFPSELQECSKDSRLEGSKFKCQYSFFFFSICTQVQFNDVMDAMGLNRVVTKFVDDKGFKEQLLLYCLRWTSERISNTQLDQHQDRH